MKFFRTLAQRRILRYYWKTNKPFTLDELIDHKVLHCRVYGKMILPFMEWLGQVISQDAAPGQRQYFGTTDSKSEWKSIKREKTLSRGIINENVFVGMNRYEIAEATEIYREMLEKYKAEIGLSDEDIE